MTAERQERNRKNSERFNNIIVWSIQNQKQWMGLCHDDTNQGIRTHYLNALIDQCLHHGFMELYYLILTKIAGVVEIGVEMERLIQFLEICVDENITLDMERISDSLNQKQEE